MRSFRIFPRPPSLSDFYCNSHARVGRDKRQRRQSQSKAVSIHAPAWGATIGAEPTFNEYGFQFTRPRGARRHEQDRGGVPACFNSRARVGRDI